VEVPAEALYPARLARPDFPVPGAPGVGLPRLLLGVAEPRFSEVGRRIVRLVVVAALGALAGELLVTVDARPFVLAAVVAIGVYVAVAVAALAVFRRQQARFEPMWLAAQSRVLRERRFDVLRFTTSEPVQTGRGRRATRRTYDLTRVEDVERLLSFREQANSSGVTVPVTIEFGYPAGETLGVEQVRDELATMRIEFGRLGSPAHVRFPSARYGVTPESGRATTYWVLGPPTVTVPQRILTRTPEPSAAAGR